MRDVMRTFQTMHIFKENEIGRIMLTRILLAISLACPEVGYCQGMNFVGGTLVANRLNVYSENTQVTGQRTTTAAFLVS